MRCSCGQENQIFASQCERCERTLLLGMDARRVFVDSSIGLGLLLALLLVFAFDRGEATSLDESDVGQRTSVTTEVVEQPTPVEAKPLRLAVTPPVYDDMGKLLRSLGEGYRYHEITMDDLCDTERLAAYDVVFLTCGYVPEHWTTERLREGERSGGEIRAARPEIIRQLHDSLRKYVGRGGTLYASDWQFRLVAVAFPEFVDEDAVAGGMPGMVDAEVIDPGLQRRLGDEIRLRFDKRAWRPAAFDRQRVQTLLRGVYETIDGRYREGPLAVQFPFEEGQVIFTSFHNEKQHSETEEKLLRHLVFTTVTAKTSRSVKRTMVRGGFDPVDRNLLSASVGDASIRQAYECSGDCDLRFVLGFGQQGAELQLTVEGPQGRKLQKTGTSTISIDVVKAATGTWHYRITPLRVPYENFPFTLTVGEKPAKPQ